MLGARRAADKTGEFYFSRNFSGAGKVAGKVPSNEKGNAAAAIVCVWGATIGDAAVTKTTTRGAEGG